VARFTSSKRLRGGRVVRCKVSVFPLWVIEQLEHWPEQHQRETRWFNLTEAAMDEGNLVTLLVRLAAPQP
jgi:uncharacterized protein